MSRPTILAPVALVDGLGRSNSPDVGRHLVRTPDAQKDSIVAASHFPATTFNVIYPRALKFAVKVNEASPTVVTIILPLACIMSIVLIFDVTMAVSLAVYPVAFIAISIVVHHTTMAMSLPMLKKANVFAIFICNKCFNAIGWRHM